MIVIGYCSDDYVRAGFSHALALLTADCTHRRVDFTLINKRAGEPRLARSLIVQDALQLDATHIMWIDSDMHFPRNTLARLQSHQLDIVGCTYQRRRAPWGPAHEELDAGNASPLAAVAWLPGGMLLVRTMVYKTLGTPYYTTFEHSEDVEFCLRAREYGYTVWLDRAWSSSITHLGEREHRLGEQLP
jgi:hypothetical protein